MPLPLNCRGHLRGRLRGGGRGDRQALRDEGHGAREDAAAGDFFRDLRASFQLFIRRNHCFAPLYTYIFNFKKVLCCLLYGL